MKLFSGFANFNPTRKEENIPSPPPTSFDRKRARKSGTEIFTSIWSSPVFWKAHSRRKQTDICERSERGRRNRQASPRAGRWRMKPLPEGEGDGPWLQMGGKAAGPRERASIFNVAKVSSRTDLWVSWKYQKNEAAKRCEAVHWPPEHSDGSLGSERTQGLRVGGGEISDGDGQAAGSDGGDDNEWWWAMLTLAECSLYPRSCPKSSMWISCLFFTKSLGGNDCSCPHFLVCALKAIK